MHEAAALSGGVAPGATRLQGATPARRIHAVAGLLFALGVPCLPIGRWDDEFTDVRHLLVHEAIWWAITATVLLHVVLVERRPLRSLGFAMPRPRDALLAVVAGGLIVMVLGLLYYVAFPWLGLDEAGQVEQLLATPVWWRAISVLRAAVSEEVLFRGYALERARELTDSTALAAVGTCAVFILAHAATWGWSHLLLAGAGGIGLTLLYLWRRNLWVNVAAHAIVDGIAVLA
jgi:membrane protease YdiL (CAAX protease family)